MSLFFVLFFSSKWSLLLVVFILYIIWGVCCFKEEKSIELKQNENIESDKAIENRAEDFLGRDNFAEEIAEKIRCFASNDSLVVGLYGEWGSGKSSFLNLMKNYLKEKNTLVFEFNPWFFANTENLFTYFLEFYYDKIKKNKLVRNKPLIKYLKKYICRIAKTQFKAENIAFSVENFLPWDLPSDSIESLKKEIDEELAKLDERIVIVIDDIDRLNPLEIRQMVTLVKLIADFPKTTYILSFDDKVVAKILADEYKVEVDEIGDKFLEKIIQMPIRLPIQESSRVESEFKSRLLKKMPWIDEKNIRFSIFQEYTFPIISNNTVRQVKRYLNSLELGLSMINKKEINTYDYLYVEFLRIYYYPIYQFIIEYKSILISVEAAFILDTKKKDERNPEMQNAFKTSLQKSCENLSHFEKDIVNKILRELFIQFDDVYNKATNRLFIGEKLRNEERDNRICSSVNFNK